MDALSENFEENYNRFIVDAVETGCVWGLEDSNGWALCDSVKYKESCVMPFWSQPEFAQAHCVNEWAHYKPVAVSTEELLDEWLPGMHEDVYLIGINWNNEMEGAEMEPLDLLQEFDDLL